MVRRHRVQPGPGAVPGRRADGGPPVAVRQRDPGGGGHRVVEGGNVRGRRHRPLGVVRGLGGQDRPGPWLVQPGGRAVLQLLAARADRGRRRARAPAGPAARVRLGRRAGHRERQHRGGAGVGVNMLTERVAEIAPWLASHMAVNAIDLTGSPDDQRDDLAVAATDNLKRIVGLSASTDWAATPTLDRMLTYLETKTVWHPAAM